MAFSTQRFLINNLATASNITASSQGVGTIRQAKKDGTGTATLTPSGSYTGSGNKTITVQCDGAGTVGSGATYRWKTSDTAAGSWEATGQSATTTTTALGSEGINITFSSGTLVLYDSFVFPIYAEYGPANLFMNDRDFYYKSGTINTELITNEDMEDGFTAGLADDWSKTGAAQTYADEGTIVHSGSHSQKITCIDDGQTIGIQQSISVTIGEEYYVSVWFRASNASNFRVNCTNLGGATVTAVTSADTWQQVEIYATATGTGAGNIQFYQSAADCTISDILYIDDIHVVALVYLDIDLGSAQTLTAIALLDHNFSSTAVLTLKGNSSESWASPGYEDATFDSTDDPIIEYDGDTYQYWRWVFQDIDNTDGFHSIGKLYLGTYSELAGNLKNIPWGSSKADSLFRVRNRSDWGKQSGHVYAKTVRFATQYFPTRTSGDLTILQNVFAATYDLDTGQDKAILLHYSYDEGSTLYLVLCLSDNFDEQYPNYAHYGITLNWEGEVLTRSI